MNIHNGLVSVFNRRTRAPVAATDVHAALPTAIVDQRLPPATHLGEEMLMEVFNLSRPPSPAPWTG